MKALATIALALASLVCSRDAHAQEKINYPEVVQTIAKEISALKKDFAQLKEFSLEKNVEPKELKIDYSFKTHRAEQTGGWSAGVPSPDDDGIWFFIDFHDPQSQREIHAQPMTTASLSKMMLGKLALSFLILEGKKSKPVEGEIWKILRKNGVKATE